MQERRGARSLEHHHAVLVAHRLEARRAIVLERGLPAQQVADGEQVERPRIILGAAHGRDPVGPLGRDVIARGEILERIGETRRIVETEADAAAPSRFDESQYARVLPDAEIGRGVGEDRFVQGRELGLIVLVEHSVGCGVTIPPGLRCHHQDRQPGQQQPKALDAGCLDAGKAVTGHDRSQGIGRQGSERSRSRERRDIHRSNRESAARHCANTEENAGELPQWHRHCRDPRLSVVLKDQRCHKRCHDGEHEPRDAELPEAR